MKQRQDEELLEEQSGTEKQSDNGEQDNTPERGNPSTGPTKRMREDIALLKELFPTLTAEEIPDEVWEKVKLGESLAASYALYFIKSVKEKERIEKINDENSKKAMPRVKSDKSGEDYFSPETVKQMSASEVRKNYAAILKSMDSWN